MILILLFYDNWDFLPSISDFGIDYTVVKITFCRLILTLSGMDIILK